MKQGYLLLNFLVILLTAFPFQCPYRRNQLLSLDMAKRPMNNNSPSAQTSFNQLKVPNIIRIDDNYSEYDRWKLEPIIDILNNGGVGVVPTDSCYSFVSSINSKTGINRLLDLKGYHGQKKPLSLFCKDYSTISKYTSSLTDEKWVYKLIRTLLPGPFTLIIPASHEVPKIAIERDNKNHAFKRWKRKEIGVRMPDDAICMDILQGLSAPLLGGSVPQAAEDVLGILYESIAEDDGDGEALSNEEELETILADIDYINDLSVIDWIHKVDFIVDNGVRGGDQSTSLSTVIDITSGAPVLLRQGKGKYDM
jgi:tRNA threonylcarbamoyl adenosine modification protein (Sua5/YciO/YrdC/YwlC family)